MTSIRCASTSDRQDRCAHRRWPAADRWVDFSAYIEDPSADEGAHFHEQINRDVKLILKQERDLVDEMIANARGMAVSDVTPPSGDLPLDQKGAEQLSQAATELAKPPAKKTTRRAAKKSAKKKAA
jgi:hypothetical protein